MKTKYFGLTKAEAIYLIEKLTLPSTCEKDGIKEKIKGLNVQAVALVYREGIKACYEEMVENIPPLTRDVPAIPPADYHGSIADWIIGLQQTPYWNGEGWYGDVVVPIYIWWTLLDECEKGLGGAGDEEK